MIFEKLQRRFLAEFVYGGIDGTVTTFAVVSGAVGASLAPEIVVVLGFANLFADGFSMAASNYLSTKSARDLHPEESSGHPRPTKTALATFVSFVAVGFIPLLSFMVAFFYAMTDGQKFLYSAILTSIAFLAVGTAKGAITGKNRWYSALNTLMVGAAAAVIAYGVGYLLRGLVL